MIERLGDRQALATLEGAERNRRGHAESAVSTTLQDDAVVDECLLHGPDCFTLVARLRQRFGGQARDDDETKKPSGWFVDRSAHLQAHGLLQVAQGRLSAGREDSIDSALQGETAGHHRLLQTHDVVVGIAQDGQSVRAGGSLRRVGRQRRRGD